MVTIDIMVSLIQFRISGILSQWRVGGHLVNIEKDDGTNIPVRGWQYQDGQGGLLDDDYLSVSGKTFF